MLRVCITAPNPLSVREVNGKKIYSVNPYYDEIIGFLDTSPLNKTYHVSINSTTCFNRMKDNSSDITTDIFSLGSFDDFFRTFTFFGDKTSMLTGYDTKRMGVEEQGSALGNFKLLEWPVYIGALFLIFLFMLAIAGRSLIRHHHRINILKAEANLSFLSAMGLEKTLRTGNLRGEICEEVFSSLFGSSSTSRYITFLFVVLCFYLCVSFSAVYQTSCIEIEDPSLVKSYDDLLRRKQPLPIFFDAIRKVADAFEFAPEDSLKGRIWSKLVKSGVDMSFHVFGSSGGWNELVAVTLQSFSLMDKKKYVVILSSLFAPLIRGSICGMSPDGSMTPEELRHLKVSTDFTESEKLSGWPFAYHLLSDQDFMRRLTLLFQSHLLTELNKRSEYEVMTLWNTVLVPRKSHATAQLHVCGDSYQPDNDNEVKAMDLPYFKDLFTALILVYCIIIVINRIECLTTSSQCARRKFRRRNSL